MQSSKHTSIFQVIIYPQKFKMKIFNCFVKKFKNLIESIELIIS